MHRIAVIVAAVLLLPVSTAAAAPTWLAPVDLSATGQSAEYPQVAVDAQGNATAVWRHYNGTNYIVQAAYRPAGAAVFSSPQDLSVTGQSARSPQIAIDAQGNATAVWDRSSGLGEIVEAAYRPAGAAAFAGPQQVSATGPSVEYPQVGVDAQGDVTVVWVVGSGPNRIVQAAYRAAGAAAFGSPQDLSATGGTAYEPQVAVSAQGNAVAVWRRFNSDGNAIVQAAYRPAGATGFGLPQDNVSTAGQTAEAPQVAIDAQGNATAVWRRSNGTWTVVQAAYRSAAATGFNSPTNLSYTGQHAGPPQIALGPNGKATAVWFRYNVVQAATRPFATTAFAPPKDLSAPGSAFHPQVAFDAQGNTTAVWKRSNGTNDIVQAAYRPAGAAAFAGPQDLSATGQDADDPQVSFDPQGNATAVWRRSNGSNFIVQAAVFDAAGPALSGLTVPATATAGRTIAASVNAVDRWSPPVSTHWDFGDGGTATGAHVSHAYATPGTYTVTVRSADAHATETTATATITITPPPTVTPPPAVTRPPAVTPPPVIVAPDTTRPVITHASLTKKRVARGKRTAFRYTLSEAAKVKIAIQRSRPGRKLRGRCVKPPRKKHGKRKHCTRHTKAGSLTATATTGTNRRRYKAKLKRGRYRAVLTATDAAGNTSKPVRLTLRITKKT